MTILVANVGSSSYERRLLEMPSERDLAGAKVERVGASDAIVTSRRGDAVLLDRHFEPVPDHLVGAFEPGFHADIPRRRASSVCRTGGTAN